MLRWKHLQIYLEMMCSSDHHARALFKSFAGIADSDLGADVFGKLVLTFSPPCRAPC